jgi:hypothetical protein
MWPRVVEVMLGCWLLVTPFVFRDTPDASQYSANAVVSAALLIAASLLAFWRRMRLAHVGTLAVALWLIAHGYFGVARPGPPAAQNEIVVGLILLLFAILPGEINDAPVPWRQQRRGDG